MSSGPGRLVYVVVLPGGTVVGPAVLGTSWAVEGRPYSFTVTLPGPPHDLEGFDRGLTRPALARAERALDWFEESGAEDEDRPQRFWGCAPAVDTLRREVIMAQVRRLVAVVSVDDEPTTDDARLSHSDEVGLAIDDWIAAVGEWLQVLVGLDLGEGEVQTTYRPRHVYPLPLIDSGDGRWHHYGTMSQGPTVLHTSPHASLAQWQLAVEGVNAGKSPPPEHLLLRDSRAAWFRDDARKALIDAVTAVEVALAGEVQRSLGPEADAEAVKRVLKNASGVIELHDLAIALGTAIPANRAKLVDQLAGRRNAAVHRGVVPTELELGEALRLADLVVRAVCPLEGATDPWPSGSVSTMITNQ